MTRGIPGTESGPITTWDEFRRYVRILPSQPIAGQLKRQLFRSAFADVQRARAVAPIVAVGGRVRVTSYVNGRSFEATVLENVSAAADGNGWYHVRRDSDGNEYDANVTIVDPI